MSNEHFQIIDEAIAPQPWTQYRLLASGTAASVSRSYGTSGGGNKNDPVHAVDVAWTNRTPIPQYVYGMVTRGGAQVTLQARSRGYLVTSHGLDITLTPQPPASFDMIEVSRFGCGLDVGRGGLLGIGTGFGMQESRTNSASAPLLPQRVGWQTVQPGETIHARVELRFRSEFWENTLIDGGDQNTESLFISGDTRLDLYGIPAIVPPAPRPVPTLVGAEHSRNFTFGTDVDVPAGTTEGDVMIAIHANQFGLITDLVPNEPGWTQVHSRDAGWENSHLKVWVRTATDNEPDSYTFGNGLLAEAITHLIVLRDASPILDDGWHIASSLMNQFWWVRQDGGHIAPSIDRRGQYLLCVSYVPHAGWQEPLTQALPDGMTELRQTVGNFSNMTSAGLSEPPRPTGQREFHPDQQPEWAGRSVTLTILVPGARTL